MMARMKFSPALVGVALIACPVVAAAQSAAPPKTIPPLVVSDQTIGVMRQHQVGAIILPQGKPPFPAVVVLHGCNGISQNTRIWARRLASWGYAALIVDSLSPRGLRQVCDGSGKLPGPQRAMDAFAGAAYLRSRPDIDGNRIGALGYSHGGWSALAASWERSAARAGAPPLRAVVSYYPYCPKVAPPLANDLLILIGNADDWANAALCTAYVDKYGADAPHRPTLKVYQGARHSFDANFPERLYFGHRLAYDPKAAADAIERTRKFLDEHLSTSR